jgi:hypothetical protein
VEAEAPGERHSGRQPRNQQGREVGDDRGRPVPKAHQSVQAVHRPAGVTGDRGVRAEAPEGGLDGTMKA